MSGEREVIKVACSVPNGLELRIMRQFDDGVGMKHQVGERSFLLAGPRNTLGGVGSNDAGAIVSEVDAETWRAWLAQNPGNPLLEAGVIREIPEA